MDYVKQLINIVLNGVEIDVSDVPDCYLEEIEAKVGRLTRKIGHMTRKQYQKVVNEQKSHR